jgi:hypothetical protein
MANAKFGDKDFPAPFVSAQFLAQGNCISIGICMILYIIAYFGVNFWMKFKGMHNKEFVECQKKAWIMIVNVMSIYLYNRVSVATTVILWFATIGHIGALVLCVLESQRIKLFKFVMSAALGFSCINVIVHFLTRAATSGNRSLNAGGTIVLS